MTQYAIMRCEKVKSFGQLSRTLKHNFREQDTPNADPERTDQNEHDGAERSTQAMGAVRERLPEKRRKDAVIAVEYMMTASPEWMKEASEAEQKAFFDQSKKWLQDKYGKENVVLTSIHRDETTPHMAAWVTPITKDGRLCAKDFIGGPAKLRKDQTDYHKAVANLGLSRGIEGSKATHERIQTFYKALQPETFAEHSKRFKTPEISSNDLKPRIKGRSKLGIPQKETPDDIARRLSHRNHEAWEKSGFIQSIRIEKINDAETNERRAKNRADRYEKKAHKMDGIEKQLQKMKEQGITMPDGKDIMTFFNEKLRESRKLELQENARSKGRGIER